MIRVSPPVVADGEGQVVVRYPLRAPAWVGMQCDELVLTYPAGCRPDSGLGNAAFLSLLPFAFMVGAHLHLDDTLALDDGLRRNSAFLCDLWGRWLRRPFVVQTSGGRAEITTPPRSGRPGQTALLFSGGLDSITTFLRYRAEINSLVFIRGADLYLRPEKLDPEAKYQTIETRLRDYTEGEGKQFLFIATNAREVFGFRYRGEMWAYVAHGCVTVAPLMALANQFSRVLTASNGTGVYEPAVAHGTHPEIVPRLSTQAVTVELPDVVVSKYQRQKLIAGHPRALRVLRVCSRETSAYNCGRCKKCCHAMLGLLVCGVEPGAAPFPPEAFTYEHIGQLVPTFTWGLIAEIMFCETLQAIDAQEHAPAGAREIAEILRRRLPYYPRFLRGEMPLLSDLGILQFPARPTWWQRAIGFPALNHGSLSKWLAGRLRATVGKQRLRALWAGRRGNPHRTEHNGQAHLS